MNIIAFLIVFKHMHQSQIISAILSVKGNWYCIYYKTGGWA